MWLAWKKYWVKWSPTSPKNYHNTSWHTINWTRTSESYYSLSLFVSDFFMIHANFLWLNVGLLRRGFPMKGQPAGWCARCVCALASSWLASHCLEARGKSYPTKKIPTKLRCDLGLEIGRKRFYFYLVLKDYLCMDLLEAITDGKQDLEESFPEDTKIPWSEAQGFISKTPWTYSWSWFSNIVDYRLDRLFILGTYFPRTTFLLDDDSEEVRQNLHMVRVRDPKLQHINVYSQNVLLRASFRVGFIEL